MGNDADGLNVRQLSLRRRIPGWALATCIAIIATCVAFLTLGKQVHDQSVQSHAVIGVLSRVSADEQEHRSENYLTCVIEQRSAVRFVDVLTKLRDADRGILHKAHEGLFPSTSFGQIVRTGIRERVQAYNELLNQTSRSRSFNCATLK